MFILYIKRISQYEVVLVVNDTTSLNYISHAETEGLGCIGYKKDTMLGIMVHDTMAFTSDGVALGLLDLQTWTRPQYEFGKKHRRKQLPIEQKESCKWLKSFKAVQQAQTKAPQTTLVSISDRESDVFELFELANSHDGSPELLIRAQQNRRVEHPQKHLWEFVASQKVSGTYTVEIPRKKKQPKRKAELAIRFAEVP